MKPCHAKNNLLLAQVSQIQVVEQVVELCRRFGNHTVKLMAPPPFPDRNLFGSPLAPRSLLPILRPAAAAAAALMLSK